MFSKIINILVYPLDKLILKPLNINTNDFFAYVFGILSAYFAADRVFEYLHAFFTGEFTRYWSIWMYLLVFAMNVAGFQCICGSTMHKKLKDPMRFFIFFSICLYITAFGMIAQWVNEVVWFILMNFKNFKYISANLPEIITPAIAALTAIIPLTTVKSVSDYYVGNVLDGDDDWIESFEEYKGFQFSTSKKVVTPKAFMCDAPICIDEKTGEMTMIPENKRFEAILVEGATGTGKTSMIVEPMCANDIERKYFFRELSKKLGYNALQAGLATLNVPYSNEFLNRNFSLNFLTPRESRYNDYKDYTKEMIKYIDPETKKIYYRGLGFTLVAPDNACIERVKKVANAYEMDVKVIDPMDPNTYGVNPFIGKDPAKVAAIISTVLKGMYEAENSSSNNVFFANVTQQAFENLAILLKLVYPKMHNGDTPNLEDMLDILNNFDLAEEMCEILKKDTKLAEEYKSLIGYFEKNFYKPPVNIHGYEIASTYGSGRKETEKFVYGAITQLDNFLRNPGIKKVLCSRNNNIDLDAALKNGDIITACTRQGDLGEIHQKAFGMFVILSFKDAVLRRPGSENTRTPHFIYIDEFPLYVNKDTEAFFTLFRKYRCGTLITIQNLTQLTKNSSLAYFKDVIITNTKTQIIFGDLTMEEAEFWSKELGQKKKFDYRSKHIYDTTTEEGNKKQTEAYMGSEIKFSENYKPGKIFSLKFKQCVYKTKNEKGSTIVGRGTTDFVKKSYYEPHKCSKYNYEIFGSNSTGTTTVNTDASSNFFSGNSDIKRYDTTSLDANVISYEENYDKKDEKDNDRIYVDLDFDNKNDFVYNNNDLKVPNNSNSDYINISENINSDEGIIIDYNKK